MRDRVVLGLDATPLDQRSEIGYHLAERVAERAQSARDTALDGVRCNDRLGPAIELVAVPFGHAEVVRDNHGRQWLEELLDDVAATVGANAFDSLDDVFAHLGLDGLD